MHRARKAATIALFALSLAACSSKPSGVLTGDSAYEMQQSIMITARNLSPERREEFERAVETIMLVTTDRRLSVSEDRLSPQAIQLLKGRTVSQVIENAKLIRSASATL
jgi:hypothetical protein